jgi:protoheme IX farnesyltransferase
MSAQRANASGRIADYLSLMRPRLLPLVFLTAPAALALDGDWPAPGTLLAALTGTMLLAGACGVLNAWWEADRDARMTRTALRALPAGRISAPGALGFGVAAGLLALLLLYGVGGWLPVGVGALALLHYVFVYTAWLKPRSPWSVVVGGATGASAPLIASAAVHGEIGFWAWVLFAIVFVWQPPHFWAITLYRRDEYAAAGFPMLPATIGPRATRRHILGWAVALAPITLLPWLLGALGPLYGLTALAGSGFFVWRIVQAMRLDDDAADRRVFSASIAQLSALFAVMLAELALR